MVSLKHFHSSFTVLKSCSSLEMSAALKLTLSNHETSSNLSLVLTLVWVIEQIFPASSCSAVVIGQSAETKSSELHYNDILQEVLKRMSLSTNVKIILEAYNANDSFGGEERIPWKKDQAVWFIDSLNSFRLLENELLKEHSKFKRNGLFCIVYTGDPTNIQSIMTSIFQRLYALYVINVNFIFKTSKETRVYTYHPYAQDTCENVSPRLQGIVKANESIHFSVNQFFKMKLKNLWGCALSVTTQPKAPFILFEEGKIKGIEGSLLNDLAERRNFTIQQKGLPKNYSNLLQSAVDRDTNITIIGLIYDQPRTMIADAVYSYMNAPVILAIPNGKRLSPWERLLYPFTFMIWFCLSSSIVLGIFIIFIIKKCCKPFVKRFVFGAGNRTPFINLWNLLYGGTIHGPLPSTTFARYLLTIWIFYAWFLRSAYIVELYIMLQDSRARSQLKNLAEVIENELTFYTIPIWKTLLASMSIPARNTRFFDLMKSQKKLLGLLGRKNANFALTMLEPTLRAYNRQKENKFHQVNRLIEPLNVSPVTFYMPKHSYLTYEFDDTLLRIMSAGLIEKYTQHYLGKNIFPANTQHMEPDKLSLFLLFGVFSVYLFLMTLCCFIFLLELRAKRSDVISRFIDFFNN